MLSTKPRVTPKDFFLWLGGMAFLYASVISLIALLFNYINVLLPDPSQYSDPYSSGIRFAIASLIVAFPVYVLIMRLLHQDLRKNPEKKDLWVRKWLIYLTLFIAGITIAIDLVMLINTYLQGELTMRFAWKALVILCVIGAGFAYYAYELKGTWERRARESIVIACLVGIVVLASIVGGFFIIGSPETQRLIKLDQQRLNDLQNIQYQVINYWQQKQKLPASLTDLKDPLSGATIPVDPETQQNYAYRITTAPYSFELCANFAIDSSKIPGQNMSYPVRVAAPVPEGTAVHTGDDTWTHGIGQACFERTIDPQRYPPYSKGTTYGTD